MKAITNEQKRAFERDGYLVVKGLFNPEQVKELREEFMRLSNAPIPGYFEPALNQEVTDPLKRYPRMMHPHRYNETAMQYMLDPNIMNVLEDLYDEPALAAQSMFYFKPPKSRGQALHQDNFYLKVEPGTCIAAWAAIDPADEENGGLLVVPQTNNDDIYCPEEADRNESFTNHFVKVPKGKKSRSSCDGCR